MPRCLKVKPKVVLKDLFVELYMFLMSYMSTTKLLTWMLGWRISASTTITVYEPVLVDLDRAQDIQKRSTILLDSCPHSEKCILSQKIRQCKTGKQNTVTYLPIVL